MAGQHAAVFAALCAICAALWLNYDALQPVHTLLHNLFPTQSDSPVVTPPETLNFDALRQYSAANTDHLLRWGTYRSGLYHGIRSRTYPYYLSAGLLWGSTHEDVSQLRHECRQEDRLQKYGWLHHDGKKYGWQSIEDQFNRVELETHYLRLEKLNGWASRISATPLEPRDELLRKRRVDKTKLSMFFYVDLGCGDESLGDACRKKLQNLVDVATEPQQTVCAGAEDGDMSSSSYTCSTVSFESEGVDESKNKNEDKINGPFAFQLSATLKVRTSSGVRSAELRYAGLQDTNVLNVKDRLVSLATRSSPQDADAEIVLDNIIEDASTLLVIQAIVEFDAVAAQDNDSGNANANANAAAAATAITRDDILLDVVFQEANAPGSDDDASASHYASPLEVGSLVEESHPRLKEAFESKFEETFQLATTKGYNASQVAFAQAAFSNLMGGVGFFYGSSLVQHDPNDASKIIESPRKPLFTAVPSRSFFPRGFLWDEGFHLLGIGSFDMDITQDVVVHWLGLMEDDGYIPREQILGETARRRVPAEFLVQHVEHANPPALLLALDKMLAQWGALSDNQIQYIQLIFPFLEKWYDWFMNTQRGAVFNAEIASFRWRGRRPKDGKLISNTLSSGLDDYPRASMPSDLEMHVDLLCWMIKASDILWKLGHQIQLPSEKLDFYIQNKARFEKALFEIHWNENAKSFFDIGEHSNDGHIENHVVVRCQNENTGKTKDATVSYANLQKQIVKCPENFPKYLFPLGDGKGGLQMQPVFVANEPETLQHVKHIGYVSIFPLLLQVLPADAPQLEAVLHQIASENHLWSPFGLRSMSTTDLFYEQANAQGDAPYWRGSIWININYLALKGLHFYGKETSGPYQKLASGIYDELRENIVNTIYSEYTRTGYLWEQYSGNVEAGMQYGQGQRCHPFSGWTALVVNIMAETY